MEIATLIPQGAMVRRGITLQAIVIGLPLMHAIMPTPADAATVNIDIGSSLDKGRGNRR